VTQGGCRGLVSEIQFRPIAFWRGSMVRSCPGRGRGQRHCRPALFVPEP